MEKKKKKKQRKRGGKLEDADSSAAVLRLIRVGEQAQQPNKPLSGVKQNTWMEDEAVTYDSAPLVVVVVLSTPLRLPLPWGRAEPCCIQGPVGKRGKAPKNLRYRTKKG